MKNTTDSKTTFIKMTHTEFTPVLGDYVLTKELFVIPNGSQYLLYAPLKKSLLSVNKTAVLYIEKIKEGLLNDVDFRHPFFESLIETGILVLKDSENAEDYFSKKSQPFDPKGITLFLTTGCSMACTYCYANGGSSHKVMQWDIAKTGLDWIFNHVTLKGRNHLSVMFHGGGEVTLAQSILKKSVQYIRNEARSRGIIVKIHAGLNGVMNDSLLDWVIENIDNATVSLDGLPEVQNAQRPLIGGNNSFDHVARTLQTMDAAGFRYGLRVTVTQESLHLLVKSVKFISENFGARTIQVEPVFLLGRAISNNIPAVDPIIFVEQFRAARKIAKERGKELKYSGARFQTLTNQFCKVSSDSFAITPDGFVSSCYEVAESNDPRADLFIYGKVDQQNSCLGLDGEKISRLHSLTVENKPYCNNCFCKWHCAGDCAAKIALLGDAWDPSNSPRCYINQELTRDQMIDFLDK